MGDQKTVTMPAAGRLFLRVNDDHLGDNSGQFEVRIKLIRPIQLTRSRRGWGAGSGLRA